MAIIYTYPRVNNPDGTELIVVSETKNKNSTRLISLAGICEFCDESNGCDHSFKYIQTSSTPPAEAIGCDQTLELTSSDGFVAITNIGNVIDFTKTTGPRPEDCPVTYVLKPIICEEFEGCVVQENASDWIFTCNALFDPFVGGLVTVTNAGPAGTPVEYKDGACWWVDLWNPFPTGTDCETCCAPPETAYKLTPCFDGLKYYTTETLTPGIAAIAFPGSVSLITTPAGELCYQISIESGDPPIAVVLGVPQDDCEVVACTPPPGTFSYEHCAEPGVYVTIEEDPGIAIGQTLSYCCNFGTEEMNTVCWEYKGDIGQPLGGTFDPCVPLDFHDNCDCCTNRCNYTYEICPGAPPELPAMVTFDMGIDAESICECLPPDVDIVVLDPATGISWCYHNPSTMCLPADVGYVILDPPEFPCDDPIYCPAPAGTYTWQSCDEGGPHVTVDIDPGTPIGEIARYCCDEGEIVNYCFEYLGNIGETVGGSFPCAGPTETYEADCMCCNFPCTYDYTACEGYDEGIFPPNIFVEVPFDITGCNCETPDATVYITIGEETWCYTNPIKICIPPSNTISGPAACGGEFCETPTTTKRWKRCDGEEWNYEDEFDPIAPPFNVPGNHYVGDLDALGFCVSGECCIVVEDTIETGTIIGWSTWVVASSCDSAYDTSYVDCNCCLYYDVVEYENCSESCEIGSPPEVTPTVLIDVCEWGNTIGQTFKYSNAPQFIKIEDCCYEKMPVQPCTPETLISNINLSYADLSYNLLWADCDCVYVEYYQYRECGSEVWIDTDTDLDSYNNGGAWENLAGDTCYEIQEGGAGGPAVDPTTLFITEYFGVGELLPCDCCEQDLREYNICDGAAGVTCNASSPATLYIDVSLVPGWGPVTHQVVVGEEITTAIQCCYTLNEVLPPCDAPTGTIISTVPDCEDIACNLL